MYTGYVERAHSDESREDLRTSLFAHVQNRDPPVVADIISTSTPPVHVAIDEDVLVLHIGSWDLLNAIIVGRAPKYFFRRRR